MSPVEYLGVEKAVNKITPLVSVCIATYQHASYIAECLDSILSQEATFPIEILVGEDQSSDGTREICLSYADRFPEKIRLFLNNRGNVISIDGQPTGRANILNLFTEARGTFIALCEGDDFWIDNTKLEKQISIFHENPECSLVFHNSVIVGSNAHGTEFSSGLTEGFYNIESVINKPWFIPTQSIVFRKEFLESGEWFKHIFNFDYAIQLMLSTNFPFFYIDEIMSAYRIHDGGTSRGREQFYHPIKLVETLSIFNCLSGFKYDKIIKSRLDNIRSEMLSEARNGISEERNDILRSAILNMGFWEKILTFRFYTYVIKFFIRKIKKIWVKHRGS